MGLEKFALEQTEKIVQHEQISEVARKALEEICNKFEEFAFKSPWKDSLKKILKNGNELTVGKAGAKSIVNPKGECLLSRRCSGYGPELPDGSPTLKFRIIRPSGTTILYAKPNVNGTFSPVRF